MSVEYAVYVYPRPATPPEFRHSRPWVLDRREDIGWGAFSPRARGISWERWWAAQPIPPFALPKGWPRSKLA